MIKIMEFNIVKIQYLFNNDHLFVKNDRNSK